MEKIIYLICGFVCLTVVSCSMNRRIIDPSTSLEHSLFFVENAKNGTKYYLSSPTIIKKGSTHTVQQIQAPALVDMDSRIEIKLLKGELSKSGDPIASRRAKELEDLQENLLKVLSAHHTLLKKIEAEIKSYWPAKTLPKSLSRKERMATPEFIRFLKDRKARKSAGKHLIGQIENIWPKDHPRRKEVSRRASKLSDIEFYEFIQDELEKTSQELEALKKRLSYTLRLEAILQSPDQENVAIHLQGYDRLDEGHVQLKDPLGLKMSARERQRFNDLWEQSAQLAKQANEIKNQEKSIKATFKKLTQRIIGVDGELGAELEKLFSDLDTKNSNSLISRTKTKLEEFNKKIPSVMEDTQNALAKKLETEVKNALKSAEKQLKSSRLGNLLINLDALRAVSKDFSPAKIPTAKKLIKNIKKDLSNGNALLLEFREILKSLENTVSTTIAKIPDAATGTTKKALETEYREGGLEKVVGDWKKLSERIEKVKNQLEVFGELFDEKSGFIRHQPLDFNVSESFEVPLEEASNTFIDLQRTPRILGDRITLKATLKHGKLTQGSSYQVDFEITRFGWSASYEPSLVLLRPSELAKVDSGVDGIEDEDNKAENFSFAPVVSWMHTYRPRVGENSGIDQFQRFAQISFGLHAAFLNYNKETSGEIGLGFSLGFWNNALQFGAGRNIRAKTEQEGQTYYFIGSSLIPLLQKLQNE